MKIKRYSSLMFILIIAISVLSGCAVQQPYTGAGSSSQGDLSSNVSYQPRFQDGLTYDAAMDTLAHILSGKQDQFGIKYYGIPGINNYTRIDDLSRLFGGGNQTHRYYNQNELDYVLFSSIYINSGMITVSPQLHIPLNELNKPVKVENGPGEHNIVVNAGLISFHFKTPDTAYKFADTLYTIQKLNEKDALKDKDGLVQFEKLAAEYRVLSVKPPISEEQRRFIVQANTLNQKKDYPGAIDLYQKAIKLDPVSYPGAYFNLALLYAQIERYQQAISYMKQYLMLAPDASDARSAQDKVYEWEIIMERNK